MAIAGLPVVASLFLVVSALVASVGAFAEQGKWTFQEVTKQRTVSGVIKGVYAGTNIYIKVLCSPLDTNVNVSISFAARKMRCYQEALNVDELQVLENLHDNPSRYSLSNEGSPDIVTFVKSEEQVHTCDNTIVLWTEDGESLQTRVFTTVSTKAVTEVTNSKTASTSALESESTPNLTSVLSAEVTTAATSVSGNDTTTTREATRKRRSDAGAKAAVKEEVKPEKQSSNGESEVQTTAHVPLDKSMAKPQLSIDVEGIFIITVKVSSAKNFSASVELEIKGEHGYLSAVDWPLLPFYGVMCAIYVVYGVAWLVVLSLQWRDLLRVQFWIGGVIFLGMIEKAAFYAEYQSVNSTGVSVQGAVLFAELVSCMKRTLARMLVIIVSLGFGIVKPRLGPMLHRVVGVGGLYFLLCSLEAVLRVRRPKHDPSKTLMLAEVPLAILDTAICWWIFSNLVQTTRTLRLRRNVVKLSLYRHFTNTLIFACVASAAFMVWVYKVHNLPKCVTDWKELWVDDAYWHLLFSVILLVIMILWRPTQNNQRYAFMPLVDAADGEDEEDAFINDAFDGMKSRNLKSLNADGTLKEKEPLKKKSDEDLNWVEENIPSSLADTALPSLLDSDEEIMNTKFEMSKME